MSENFDNLYVLDVETTGLNPKEHSIIEIAVYPIKPSGESFYSRIKPIHRNFTDEAFEVNGITPEEAEKGEDAWIVLYRFQHFMSKVDRPILCGHNIAFDLGFLSEMYEYCGQLPEYGPGTENYHVIDTWSLAYFMCVSRGYTVEKYNLDSLCSYFGIPRSVERDEYGVERPAKHDALSDARATAELVKVLVEDYRL